MYERISVSMHKHVCVRERERERETERGREREGERERERERTDRCDESRVVFLHHLSQPLKVPIPPPHLVV